MPRRVSDCSGESREPLEARRTSPSSKNSSCVTAYERAIYLGRDLRGSTDEGQELMTSLTRVRELLLSEAGRDLDASLYWNLIASLQKEHDLPAIRGAACGLLYGAGRLSESELGSALAGHLNGMLQADAAVSFLRGLLHTAREVAWQRPELLTVLDGLLREWSDPDFTAILPELRLAFAAMTPKETDRISQSVAHLHDTEDLGRLVHHDISVADVTANLGLSQSVLALLKADDLEAWGL